MTQAADTSAHMQGLTEERLREALTEANLPTLLLCLHQLTGDERWLGNPYTPTRAYGVDDHDSGGLADELQDEARAAALDAVFAWRRRRIEPAPLPAPEVMAGLLSFMLGEIVPVDYGELLSEEAGFTSRSVDVPDPGTLDVLVIGAGMAGINIAIELKRNGIPYTIVEKNHEVGGTWLENRYPGCGVDTQSHLYSYAFARRSDWMRYFARRDQLASYFSDLADEHALREDIRFGVEVESARFEDGRWHVDLDSGETLSAKVLISGVGHFNRPNIPPIKGLDSFAGPCMHTAQWDPDVDVTGKRVAVVGNGASAMQLVPHIAGTAGQVTVFQRSPHWCVPHPNLYREVSENIRYLLQHVPFYDVWYRLRNFWRFGDRLQEALEVDPDYPQDRAVNAKSEKHRQFLIKFIESELEGHEELIEPLTPDYPPYARRPLVDHGWYRALVRDDVELAVGTVTEVRGNTVIAGDGREFEADILVLATGFKTLEMLGPMEITGRSGKTLRETWGEDDAHAYLGMTVPDFPNFFILFGPNTNSGHGGSAFLTVEFHTRYVMQVLAAMAERGLETVEVRPEVHERYDREVDEAMRMLAYSHPKASGSYYRNADGRIVGSNPFSYLEYHRRTQRADLGDFIVR